jgi:hypothetical protein
MAAMVLPVVLGVLVVVLVVLLPATGARGCGCEQQRRGEQQRKRASGT